MNHIKPSSVSSDLLTAEREILTRVAAGGALTDVMRDIILMIEAPSHGEMLASILVTSENGKQLFEGAAPSLPAEYNAAVHGIPVALGVGSCGTAAFTGEPVIATDIATNPHWADYREIALAHGLRACWSMPILAADGRVLGTFANYYREPREPTERDLEVISMVTRTAAIAIERTRNEVARERAEEQRILLLRELNHRVKNVFTLIDSLLLMSARSATSVEAYAQAIRGRLYALSRAHELVQPGLAQSEVSDPTDVPLKQVVSELLAPYVQDGTEKFMLAGSDDVLISPRAITGISLVLHELATNAAKYGALGHPDGKLLVSWSLAEMLQIEWSERGGPVPAARGAKGFGSKLIHRTVEGQFQGKIIYRWEPHGLDIMISLPVGML
ncbi:GAF domain-containing protein [Methylobacterium sp. C25]|uniref:sensor histidine kinase n=1 Tax=Methylobacterium sp. C25 TaxID=2721622 RepID=UPI001F2E3F1B|nr:GAF domain-containing protein [Methylobacterium sp. C25]MCE4226227.1 GAF domain-containing protein [Methylobacterium sp. C25]